MRAYSIVALLMAISTVACAGASSLDGVAGTYGSGNSSAYAEITISSKRSGTYRVASVRGSSAKVVILNYGLDNIKISNDAKSLTAMLVFRGRACPTIMTMRRAHDLLHVKVNGRDIPFGRLRAPQFVLLLKGLQYLADANASFRGKVVTSPQSILVPNCR